MNEKHFQAIVSELTGYATSHKIVERLRLSTVAIVRKPIWADKLARISLR